MDNVKDQILFSSVDFLTLSDKKFKTNVCLWLVFTLELSVKKIIIMLHDRQLSHYLA